MARSPPAKAGRGQRLLETLQARHNPDHRRKDVEPKRIVIMGAAGRDFHNFNVLCRDEPGRHVVAFTDDPNFRAMYPGLQRLFINAALFGPGH